MKYNFQRHKMDNSKTPVSVITGFLGAGKTTLLNQLLNNKSGKKYAIIVNEFGEIGIDNDLVVGADEEIFELNNGCVCCNVRGDLIRILGALFKRKSAFDAILVETTGLANPAPVAQTFFADDDIARRAYLDGIITIVDAVNIISNLNEFEEATNQIAFADVIILNKISKVSAQDVENIKDAIRAINIGAKIIETDNSKIDDNEIFNLNSYDDAKDDAINRYFQKDDHKHDHNGHHHHGHHHHQHHNHLEQNGVKALCIKTDRPLDENRFMNFLSTLVGEFGEKLLRFKGIVKITNQNAPFVFNGVHMMVDADYKKEKKITENFESRLVFIGKELPQEEIVSNFKACEN